MYEKVNPCHPDKVADRIAGAIVDLAYEIDKNPKIAVEVLLGHGKCSVIVETNLASYLPIEFEIADIIKRITDNVNINCNINIVPQDVHLSRNQDEKIRCGDNGIFKGVPLTEEEKELCEIAKTIYKTTKTDGKYILNGNNLIICQSNIDTGLAKIIYEKAFNNFGNKNIAINPLGDWTGGINVDSGATNRKLGSDMAQSVTGGGLHGKDLSKADVSVNIYAWLKAQETKKPVELCCAIGDETIDGKPYEEIVEIARKYIKEIGGFEKFAEWGLV